MCWFIILTATIFANFAHAREAAPFTLPNGPWTGIDGNWSTVEFSMGKPSQPVQVLVSTTLSEFWVIGPEGCASKDTFCSAARGGVYNPQNSKSFKDIGEWQLGLEYLGYGGNGAYGLDTVRAQGTHGISDFTMDGVLTAAISNTDYFIGLFGLGTTQGSFGDQVVHSPITQAVETFGLIPSYSYGYTSGAHYRNTPASITLGGYDSARFIHHATEFTLAAADNLPTVLIRAISVTPPKDDSSPESLNYLPTILSDWDSKFVALVDSTTPFLWLPDTVCDSFAAALNLTYDETLHIYTITDDQYKKYTDPQQSHDFVFTLSSSDNNDYLPDPLNMPGIVNITIPSRALIATLEYPFMDEAIKYGDPAVPYFSLRKTGDNSTFIIGRSFLQEAYMVTQYDKRIFSIHQALFPEDPNSDAEIIALERPSDSPFPPPKSIADSPLSAGVIGGIASGAFAVCAAVALGLWIWRQKKNKASSDSAALDSDMEEKSSLSIEPQVVSPISRFVSKLVRRNTKSNKNSYDQHQWPFEAPNHEIFELPAPEEPVELDGNDGGDHEIEYGWNDTQNMSPYQQARLKMDRQLAGPVPEYTPSESGLMPPPEKMTVMPTSGYIEEQPDIPISPPVPDSDYSNSLGGPIPSPVSPRPDWSSRYIEDPSPLSCKAPPFPPVLSTGGHGTSFAGQHQSLDPNVVSQPHSNTSSPVSPSRNEFSPGPAVQRTPIDHSRVICLGPIPNNIRLSPRGTVPQILGPDGKPFIPHYDDSSHDPSEDTLGSNFTVEEESRRVQLATLANQAGPQWQQSSESSKASNPRWSLQTEGNMTSGHVRSNDVLKLGAPPQRPQRRDIIEASELVHVPQIPDKRYSWEEDRS